MSGTAAKTDMVVVPDIGGDLIMMKPLDPRRHDGAVVSIELQPNCISWVGNRAQLLELLHGMTEYATRIAI